MSRSELLILLDFIHVDDLMPFARAQEHVDAIKRTLRRESSIKDLESPKCCFGIEEGRDIVNTTIRLHQRAYIKRLAEKFRRRQVQGGAHTSQREREAAQV